MEKLLRKIYTFAFYLSLPFIIARLFWKSRVIPNYRRRVLERFSIFKAPEKKGGIWIHAVSLGEVNAIAPLINLLKKEYSSCPITITTMTVTGSERVRLLYGQEVFHVYLPYDVPCFIKKFIAKIQPRLLIVVETELWPNLLHTTHDLGIKILLANGRLSERSALKYQKIQPITRSMLQCFSKIAVQTTIEKQRYIQLGLAEEKLEVTGSIKFDMNLPEDLSSKTAYLRMLIGENRKVFIAASTHEGEENILLEVVKALRHELPELLFILVPRHPERFDLVYEQCLQNQFSVIRRSQEQACTAETQVFLGDSMGELMAYYNLADVVFVGGSFVPVGGHNVLEPAMLKKAIMTGPNMFNFLQITQMMIAVKALIQVQNAKELKSQTLRLFQDTFLSEELGKNALRVIEDNRGALLRHLKLVEQLL